MRVEELMTREVRTCLAQDTMQEAARQMWNHDLGSIPVVDGQRRVVGMITDRDVCMAAYTQGRPLFELRVVTGMSSEVHACRPGDSLSAAEATMRRQQVCRLPVVDDDDQLVGVLSIHDVARAAVGNAGPVTDELAATLSAIGRSRKAVDPDPALLAPRPKEGGTKKKSAPRKRATKKATAKPDATKKKETGRGSKSAG